MQKTSPWLVRLAYLYLVLPVFIFITGWCNIPTALAGGLIILGSLFFTCKNAPSLWMPQNKQQLHFLCMVGIISLTWVYLSGIGALSFQNLDHNCRNPLFELLVTQPWPVVLDNPPAILTYYIGFWMPSALVGKLAHSIQLGYYAQVVWASLGVFLVFYLILATVKRKNYGPIVLFILFSGMDLAGCILMGKTTLVTAPLAHLEWWYPAFQFSSFTTQLIWVFNQALPAWLAVLLLYHEKNNKSLAFIYA